MTGDPLLACRSVGPAGEPCGKKRGHQVTWHGPATARWADGVNRAAKALPPLTTRVPAFAATTVLRPGELPCRSVGPADQPCELARGHASTVHVGIDSIRWSGGVNQAAQRRLDDTDDGFSEHGYFRPLATTSDRWLR